MRPSTRPGRIRTPDQRLRVFVSSTLGELADERRAVREAVEQLHLSPVMFELGARPHPPRALYRSYLEQSDVFVGIYWQRYGWVAPEMEVSGLEDELLLSRGMPRLVYVKRPAPDMDPGLRELLQRLQDEDTTSYKPFRDAAELRELVIDDLALMLTEGFAERAGPGTAVLDAALPVPSSSFVGREELLATVRGLLASDEARLVTLTGPGGAGKTRLCLEALRALDPPPPDGVVWVDLSAESDEAQVWATVARTIGVDQGDRSAPDALEAGLGERRALLVLDNFEQVTAAAAQLAHLTERCPRLTVVVTSREALRVRGEVLVPVPPLTLPGSEQQVSARAADSEAVRLFVERAAAAVPGFDLADADVPDAVAVCRRLDGLPLAIELAAARMRVFSLHELRERLETSLDELRDGPRDLPERHQTLRRTVAWSTGLLAVHERRVLGALTGFTGARLHDVEAVLGRVAELSEVDVVDCIGSLLDKNLLRTDMVAGRPRFSMLETIREHAQELAAEDPSLLEQVRRAHAEHFSDLAARWRDLLGATVRPDVLAASGDEHGNLRLAWSYWVECGDLARLEDLLDVLWAYYDSRGAYQEAISLGDDLLTVLSVQPESVERVRDEIAMQASLARSLMAVRGYTADVESSILEAVQRTGDADQSPRRFSTLRSLGTLHLLRADTARSREISTELLELAGDLKDPALLTDAHQLAGIAHMSVDVQEGLAHLETAIAHFEAGPPSQIRFRVGPHPGIVSLVVSGLLLWMVGHPGRAERRVERGLQRAEDLGHPYTTAYALFHASLLALWRRDLTQVAERAHRLQVVADDHDYPVWRALALVLNGVARVGEGEPEEGLRWVDEGIDLYRGLSAPPIFWSGLLTLHAVGCLMAGRPEQALGHLDAAEAAAWDGDPEVVDIERLRGQAFLAVRPPDRVRAVAHLERSAQLAEELGTRMGRLEALTALAELAEPTHDARRRADVRRALTEVYGSFTEGFGTPALVAARRVLDDMQP